MTKKNFIDYVTKYHFKLSFVKQKMVDYKREKQKIFDFNDFMEVIQENLIFWDFYSWAMFKSGFSRTGSEMFTKRHFEQIVDVMINLSEKLLNDKELTFDKEIIQKTWKKFIYNLMLNFKEVEQWTNQSII